MFVQPGGLSSLIFVVIIGVWAAYFIQYWVRRREHLATARSVDQFSESMRVLERRSPLPATDLSTPRRESYAVSPARASRPQILVKRGETPVAFATESAETVEPSVGAAAPLSHSTGGPSPRGRFREEPAAPAPAPSRAPGLSLLGSLVAFVLVGVLALFSVVPLWLLALPLVAGAGSFVWVRQTVQQARLARRAAARRPAPRQAAPAPVRRQAPAATAVPAPRATATDADVSGVEGVAPEAPTARTTELYDIHAIEQPAPAAAPATPAAPAALESPAPETEHAAYPPAPLVDEDDIPLTWDPVPVPRPTYTMKARATRHAPTSADLVGDADTEYADTADDAATQLPERRVAGA